jgi:hypothetical protein
MVGMTGRPTSLLSWLALLLVPLALGCGSVQAGAGGPGAAPEPVPATSPNPRQPSADPALNFSNRLGAPVNVYVVVGGVEMFLREVSANSSEHIPVRGVASGAMVTLRAVTLDAQRVYTRSDVVLDGLYTWQIP